MTDIIFSDDVSNDSNDAPPATDAYTEGYSRTGDCQGEGTVEGMVISYAPLRLRLYLAILV